MRFEELIYIILVFFEFEYMCVLKFFLLLLIENVIKYGLKECYDVVINIDIW